MTPIAVTMLVISAAIVWGGFIASCVFLARRPEIEPYPLEASDSDGSGG